jgi:hypothetical protein
MTTYDIITKIIANVNRDDLTRAMVLQYLNNRKFTIQNYDNFSFMEQTAEQAAVALQQSYSIPTDYKDELQMWLLDGTQKTIITKWGGSEAEKNFTQTDRSGKPTNYWLWQDAYFLYPLPDKSYSMILKYYRYIPDFTDVASEENELCKRYPDLLINGGTSDSYHFFKEWEKVGEWEGKYKLDFQILIRREGRRPRTNTDSRMKVRVR